MLMGHKYIYMYTFAYSQVEKLDRNTVVLLSQTAVHLKIVYFVVLKVFVQTTACKNCFNVAMVMLLKTGK